MNNFSVSNHRECFTSLLSAFCLVFIMICRMYYDIFFMSDCKVVWVSPMDLSQINHCNAFLSTFMCWISSGAFTEPVSLILLHKVYWDSQKFWQVCTGISWISLTERIPVWTKSPRSIVSVVALSLHFLGSFVFFYCFPIPGFLVVLFYRRQPNKHGSHLAILWKNSSSPQACISATNDTRKIQHVSVTNLLFNFLFHPLLPLALFFLFLPYILHVVCMA